MVNWGAYHWGTKADVAKQVKNFLDYAEPDQSTLVALDFQRTGANTMILDQAREFLSRIEEELRRKAVIYSGELIKARLGRQKDLFFGAHRLWLAHYNVHPVVQRSWDKYWLWQYTDNTKGIKPNRVPGIPGDSKGNLDCNSYDGTRAQLNDEWASWSGRDSLAGLSINLTTVREQWKSTACRASKGIAGDQTRNQLCSQKTGPELGRLRHPWYNCTAFSISRHSWLGLLALIYCARRRRLAPGRSTSRSPRLLVLFCRRNYSPALTR